MSKHLIEQLRNKILEKLKTKPEKAAQIITNWVHQSGRKSSSSEKSKTPAANSPQYPKATPTKYRKTG